MEDEDRSGQQSQHVFLSAPGIWVQGWDMGRDNQLGWEPENSGSWSSWDIKLGYKQWDLI